MREKLNVHPVEELGEALAHTLRGGVCREGRLQFTTEQAAGGPQPPIQHYKVRDCRS